MSDRRNAWVTHAIIVFLVVALVGVWAISISREDHDGWHIGSAIAFIGFAASLLYALLATIVVLLWGRRPLAVVALHVASLTLVTILFVSC